MSGTGEEDEVPPRFDDENNMNNNQEDDESRASGGPSLEDLMRRLEKLTTENNKLRRKAKVQHPQDNRNNMVKKLEKGKPHQRLPLNHQRSKFKRRGLKKWNMQGVSS
jgi:hypothetical protein